MKRYGDETELQGEGGEAGVVWRAERTGRGNRCGGQVGAGEAQSVSGANARLGHHVSEGLHRRKGTSGAREENGQRTREGWGNERKEGEKKGKDEDGWDWHRHSWLYGARPVALRRGLSSGLEEAIFRGDQVKGRRRRSNRAAQSGYLNEKGEPRTEAGWAWGALGILLADPGSQSSRRESARAAREVRQTPVGIDGSGRLRGRLASNDETGRGREEKA
ncbi:hypothetical protein B0H14DRAFT_2654632 [Mycena olivaceomarginata]|nr:hypothetical protein B0H14DRAFT_2654632 [Mycena olivaceomarginata]